MNPLLLQLAPYALRALKLLLHIPKARTQLAADIAAEGRDVSPEIVNALGGNADAIKLLDEQIDEALAFNAGLQDRLEERIRRGETGQ